MHPSQRNPAPDPDPEWKGCVADGCREAGTHEELLDYTMDGPDDITLITEWRCEIHRTTPHPGRRLR